MADTLQEAFRDYESKKIAWLAARDEYARVREIGNEAKAFAQEIALDPSVIAADLPRAEAAIQALQDSTTAIKSAALAIRTTYEAALDAYQAYADLEYAWATRALSNFHERWQRARSTAAHRG